jgi:DNA-binding CsgD family transcriptional regulator/tetratricopeptide (TPR) repeat protein
MFALRSLPPGALPRTAEEALQIVQGRDPLALPAAEARARFFDAMIEVLRAAARTLPLLLVLDNLQWADPGSLKLLERLAADIADTAMLVVATCRDTDLDECRGLRAALADIATSRGYLRIELRGLSPLEVREYLRRTTSTRPSASLAEEIQRRTDGNPLFLREVVRDLVERGPGGGPASSIPRGVREAITVRLQRLSADCLSMLGAASVIGRVFGQEVLAQMMEGAGGNGIASALGMAREAGFVQDVPREPGALRFVHALVQEVLYEGLPSLQRARLHARVAAAIEVTAAGDGAACADTIARHLAAAADPQSLERVVPFALAAADHAMAHLAPEKALALLDDALQARGRMAGPAADAGTAQLLHRKARALDDMARSEEAVEALTRAFDLYAGCGDVAGMVDVALTPVQRAIPTGKLVTWSYADAGLPDLRARALAVVEPGTLRHARLLAHQSSTGDLERALAIARREEDRPLEVTTLWHLSYAHLCAGDAERARAEEADARRMAEELGDRSCLRFLLYLRCRSSTLVGDLASLEETTREMILDAERSRSRLALGAAYQARAILAHMKGEWDLCRQHGQTCLRLQPGSGETHSHAVTLSTLALTEYETGHPAAAQEHLEALSRLMGNAAAPFPYYLPKMAWISGDTSRVGAATEALASVPTTESPLEWATMSRTSAQALIAVIRGDRGEAERHLMFYSRWRGFRIPWNASGLSSDAHLALLLETVGRHEEACAAFEEALVFCRRTGYLPELAHVCRDYGERLARRGSPAGKARALEVLREGAEVSRRLGMSPTSARIDEALRKAQEGAGSRHAGNPDGLSTREVEVLRFVARGFTNAEIGERLFISPHTVARHVQNVLDKTGMSNRTEATAYAFRNGLMDV